MRHWFLPDMPDVLALLRDQAHTTQEGLRHFADWANGDLDSGALVRDAEAPARLRSGSGIEPGRRMESPPARPCRPVGCP